MAQVPSLFVLFNLNLLNGEGKCDETETPPSQPWIIEQPQADAIASIGTRAALLEDFEQIQDISVSSVRAVRGYRHIGTVVTPAAGPAWSSFRQAVV